MAARYVSMDGELVAHEDATIHTRIDRRGPPRALLPAVAFSQALLNLIDGGRCWVMG